MRRLLNSIICENDENFNFQELPSELYQNIFKWMEENPILIHVIRLVSKRIHKEVHQFAINMKLQWNWQPFDKWLQSINIGFESLDLIRWMVDFGFHVDCVALNAASSGRKDILKWALNRQLFNRSISNNLIINAAINNHVHILHWLKKIKSFNVCGYLSYIGNMAAQNGNIPMLEWLYSENYSVSYPDFNTMIVKGHIDLLSWLETNDIAFIQQLKKDKDSFIYCNQAVIYNHFIILKWLREKHNFPWLLYPLLQIVTYKGKRVEILEYLIHSEPDACLKMSSSQKERLTEHAITSKELLTLKTLYHHGLFKLPRIVRGFLVVRFGNLQILKWLAEIGEFDFDDESLCIFGAMSKDIEILKWLRQHGCSWNSRIYRFPIQNDDLQMIKWLRENQCPWDAWVYSQALGSGNEEIIQWLINNGCPQ